jgi:hypothetical protein
MLRRQLVNLTYKIQVLEEVGCKVLLIQPGRATINRDIRGLE